MVQEVGDGLGGPSCWFDDYMYLALRAVKDMPARPESIFGVWRYGERETCPTVDSIDEADVKAYIIVTYLNRSDAVLKD